MMSCARMFALTVPCGPTVKRWVWVIDPSTQVVESYSLGADRRFHPNVVKDDKIASSVLSGFYLRPSWLWQKPLPRVVGVLREMGVTL